jgi:hypothetical protein
MENGNVIINRKENTDEYDKQYHRKYYERKKTEIKERVSVKSPCSVCNEMIQKQHLSKHRKTSSCQMHASYKQQLLQQQEAVN